MKKYLKTGIALTILGISTFILSDISLSSIASDFSIFSGNHKFPPG